MPCILLLFRESFSFSTIQNRQADIIDSQTDNSSKSPNDFKVTNARHDNVIHPYLGYVAHVPNDPLWKDYGIFAEENPLTISKDPNVVIVGITGASVAEYFFRKENKREILRSWLKKVPKYHDKKIILAMFSATAYHQPQQFLAIAYYLAQGGRLDVLINLDGVGEAILTKEVLEMHIYPTYPYLWNNFFINSSSSFYSVNLGKLMMWRNIRNLNARIFSHANFSISALTIWALTDKTLERKATESEAVLNKKNTQGFHIHGPKMENINDPQYLLNFQERIWTQSSLQTEYLAQKNNFDYFHFLQPNQYVPDTKPLSSYELTNSHNDAFHMTSIQSAYPRFQANIETLRSKGVQAYDLTHIYDDAKETIFIDYCCHTNDLGEEILVQEIGQRIVDFYKKN